jgi:hypothetical protein
VQKQALMRLLVAEAVASDASIDTRSEMREHSLVILESLAKHNAQQVPLPDTPRSTPHIPHPTSESRTPSPQPATRSPNPERLGAPMQCLYGGRKEEEGGGGGC